MTDPGVLVLTGPPCSGKSSVVPLLAGGAPAGDVVPVEVDSVFSLLLPRSDRNRRDRMLAYDAAHALARVVVGSGRTPVLECTYARVEQRTSLLEALADVPDVPLRVVELVVTPDEAVARFFRRDQETDLDEQSLRDRVDGFPYSDHGLRVEAARCSPEDLADRIATWWQSRPAPVDRDRWAAAGRGWD